MRNKLAAAGLMLVGLSASAFANTVSYSASFGPMSTDFSTALNLQKFNPALGTLTGVSITLSAADSVTALSFTNNSNNPITFSYSTSSTVSASGIPDSLSAFVVNLYSNGSITTGAHATTTIAPPAIPANGSNSVNAAAANFGFYTGTGTFALTGSTNTTTTLTGGGGNIAANQATSATLSAVVTYTYTTGTPEPMSMSLMGGGLCLVGFLGRKRFGRKAA